MSDHIESLMGRVVEAVTLDSFYSTTENLKAALWEIDAEAWERGVMWKGGIGMIPPERPDNPFRTERVEGRNRV